MAIGPTSDSKAISNRPSGRGAGVFFFSIFFLAGFGFFIPTVVLPVWRVIQSRDWRATPCTILSSTVDSSRSSKGGSTYSPKIRYRYHFKAPEDPTGTDRVYESDHDWPLTGHYGDNDPVDLVRRYRARQPATCYVNPANPAEAILSRELPLKSMAFALLPLLFMAIGAGGIFFALRRGGTIASPLGPKSRFSQSASPELRAKQGPVSSFVGMLIFMLFWNGIVSVFVVEVVGSYRHGGHGDLCLTIFLIPFVAVGIGLIVAWFYTILALFNPRVHVTLARESLDREELRPGDSTEVRWRFSGRSHRITQLTVTLEGREEATYRRGTNTVTDKLPFHKQQLASTVKAFEIASGSAKFTIPPRTMHTFASANNKIVWELQFHGEIPNWPDVKQQLAVTVLPAEVQR